MKVLIIEDDPALRFLVKSLLEREHYEVYDEENGVFGLRKVKEVLPDFIVLDIMLPDISGFYVCEQIRKRSDLYGNPFILMLTAKEEIEGVRAGFESGADDYLKKPFENIELLLRIRAISRRNNLVFSKKLKYYDIVIDTELVEIFEDDIPVKLSKTEFELLIFFIKNKGIVLSREKIMESVWNSEYFEGNKTIDFHLKNLKEKIRTFRDNLEVVRGFGYKLK